MTKHNEQFEHQLEQHFSERKKRHSLSAEQRATLAQLSDSAPNKKPTRFLLPLQMTGLACALVALGFTMFNTTDNNPDQLSTLNTYAVQQSKYHFIEVHQVDNAGSYSSEITRKKQRLDDKLAADLRLHQQRYIEYGQLVNVDDDWYIASCHSEMLIQIKDSLLNDLNTKHAIESNITMGDMLAMAHNSQGQIIALKHAGSGVKVCKG
ncbi:MULTISPECIES: hypothetical protein [unclassified Pseudoalteromonas]|uniref:hypothetical protein n=1 Tax=unclassified Pseudoalteromonas TaxID=194690 RepID=UPI0025B327A2|nr:MULTISPECIES: hypothetical protein [unclassified Pseudoalteromonas]MDN3379277.1 hypothetical protein [Pseudoalteromonas sp. APC 3893]MDN3386451.1 hypothetical protein [Pseudoalteromonas sp. APC 4017]